MATHGSKVLGWIFMVAAGLAMLPGLRTAAVLADEPSVPPAKLVSCNFDTQLPAQWKTIGATWEVQNGSLTRSDPRPADPAKALAIIGDSRAAVSRDISIIAKLRLDSTKEGEFARAGVSVCSDPETARGLNLVFNSGRLQYVHDYVVWGPFVDFPCRVGTWYWIKLSKKGAQLKGKAWQDGDPEPANWMVDWEIPDPSVTGYPGVVAGAGGPAADTCPVSFDRCAVLIGDIPSQYYTKRSTWRATMAASREALARQEIALADDASDQAGYSLLRTGLWDLLYRDFPDPALLQQMAVEQEDEIWNRDWPFAQMELLAERYADATRAGLSAQAHELAQKTRTAEDLELVSKLYHRSKEIERTLANWKETDLHSLQLAVEDLLQTYGPAYAEGPNYLQRIAQIEQIIQESRPGNTSVDFQRFYDAVQQFHGLRDEALLANPLMDFAQLLVVKRKDSRAYRPLPNFVVPPFSTGPTHLLNGLPLNYQGNGVLRQIPIENEIATLSPLRPDGVLKTVYRPERPMFVGDVTLHFDADRMLFSSIGSHDRFQIFEVGVDGNNLRQVTRGEADDVDSYDSCYLADDRILFGSSACFQSVPCERRYDEVANFCVMNSDGSGVRRLCFDQDHNFYPSMMSDGRVLYTRWEYTDIAHAFSARMFTMNPDGTEQRAYYASSSYWPNRVFYAKPIPDHPTQFVGIVTGHHGTARAGQLVLFDVARGRQLAEGVVQRIPGWGKQVEATLEDTLVDETWPKFLHPYPLSDKYFLVSCQPTSQSPWGIYLVDVFDNMTLLHEEEGWLLFEPIPLRKTPRPRLIPDRVDLNSREATVYLSDIYAGQGLPGVPRGTVKKLRLFTYHFNYFGTSGIEDYVGMDGPWDVRRVLGTVPVTEDGSAYFVVPANTPIAVQPLDSEGKALQLMRSWFTAMPGERVACVGCHEQANDAPPERSPLALASPPSPIEPWYGPVRGFSWDREVQPVLDQYCVGCHNGNLQADGGALPDLRRAAPRTMPHSDALFPPSFYELRRFVRSPGLEGSPRVLPVADYHADANPLMRMLRKGHRNVRLDSEAWDRLATWLDMNAPAYGTWLEIPSVSGNAAVGECRVRRMESLLQFGGIDEDPEALPAVQPAQVAPVLPPKIAEPTPVQVAGWPFSAEEAKRRQAEAGAQTEMEIDLGPGCKMQFVLVPAGDFVLGGSATYADEQPLSKATIDKPFWIGKFEVTNVQYQQFNREHQSGLEPMLWLKWSWEDYVSLDQPQQPVCRVSWHDANAFCDWLSQQTGKTFGLPSEAEWEWACRAGTDTPLNFGPLQTDSALFANLADESLHNFEQWPRTTPFSRLERVRQFHAVDPVNDGQRVSAEAGSYLPNRWGLYDMHGNVSEWTNSDYLPYAIRPDDARPADPNIRKVARGGSWYDRADLARSGCRTSYWPWQPVFDVGFRVVCEAE